MAQRTMNSAQLAKLYTGWTSDILGSFTYDQIKVAMLGAILGQLELLNAKLDNLGVDGIHGLIRIASDEASRRDVRRRQAKRSANRRARDRKRKETP